MSEYDYAEFCKLNYLVVIKIRGRWDQKMYVEEQKFNLIFTVDCMKGWLYGLPGNSVFSGYKSYIRLHHLIVL